MIPQLLELLGSAGSSGSGKLYVEDVFSTWLYTGTSSAQTISNGIDLAGKGGLTWIKWRSGSSSASHQLADTDRGTSSYIYTNNTSWNTSVTDRVTAFNSSGFSLGTSPLVNGSNIPFASWTFRKASKFFDILTWTGDGASSRLLTHNLTVSPGFVLIKRTDAGSSWVAWSRGLASPYASYLDISSTLAAQAGTAVGAATGSIYLQVYNQPGSIDTNEAGGTYVAYLFAHDPAADGIIQSGSFTPSGGTATVDLGWEPQLLLIKDVTNGSDWQMLDTMRGLSETGVAVLRPNTSSAEQAFAGRYVVPTATGFYVGNGWVSDVRHIYMAIRRGPMKTPTSGTSVFSPIAFTSSFSSVTLTPNFPVDMVMGGPRSGAPGIFWGVVYDRLRGGGQASGFQDGKSLNTYNTSAEGNAPYVGFNSGSANISTTIDSYSQLNYNDGDFTFPSIAWNFRRAPGFFDEVCYSGTGAVRTVNHNLGVAPELIIIKRRNDAGYDWAVGATALGNWTQGLILNGTSNSFPSTSFNNTPPTAFVFSLINSDTTVNGSGGNYVAYLFASCPGVSKVGSYTGNGTSQTINCGFSNGARFVLIKRTDSTGDWYVWDTARGIVTANDPHLSLNTTAGELTDDSLDPDSTGFIVNQVSATNVNVNGATYIYLSVA